MSELISPEYLEQQRQLHGERDDYGVSAATHAQLVMQIAMATNSRSILDYGCGKAVLQEALPQFQITCYDPAIDAFSVYPTSPHDLVYCGDVLEHIEPDRIDNVLDELERLSVRACIVSVSTREAKKILPDGRNAHLIVMPYNWWIDKLAKRFVIHQFTNSYPNGFVAVMEPKRNTVAIAQGVQNAA